MGKQCLGGLIIDSAMENMIASYLVHKPLYKLLMGGEALLR